jgi:hypothetical protein
MASITANAEATNVLASTPTVGLEAFLCSGIRERRLRQALGLILGGEKARETPADDFVRLVALEPLGARVPADDVAAFRLRI